MAQCSVCGENAGFMMSMCDACLAKQNEAARTPPQQPGEPRIPEQACSGCGSRMEPLGQLPLRTGGVTGGWHMVFGEMADAGEEILKLDVYRCGECKRVEFFDLDLSIPPQTR
ncbi:MAG TPA: hypothetical protein VF710_23005 [Longimicrobium sp.]|jgi:hypothetical protein